jgi:hypothetical protein
VSHVNASKTHCSNTQRHKRAKRVALQPKFSLTFTRKSGAPLRRSSARRRTGKSRGQVRGCFASNHYHIAVTCNSSSVLTGDHTRLRLSHESHSQTDRLRLSDGGWALLPFWYRIGVASHDRTPCFVVTISRTLSRLAASLPPPPPPPLQRGRQAEACAEIHQQQPLRCAPCHAVAPADER